MKCTDNGIPHTFIMEVKFLFVNFEKMPLAAQFSFTLIVQLRKSSLVFERQFKTGDIYIYMSRCQKNHWPLFCPGDRCREV